MVFQRVLLQILLVGWVLLRNEGLLGVGWGLGFWEILGWDPARFWRIGSAFLLCRSGIIMYMNRGLWVSTSCTYFFLLVWLFLEYPVIDAL